MARWRAPKLVDELAYQQWCGESICREQFFTILRSSSRVRLYELLHTINALKLNA
jgi:hypothetical protein